MGERRTRRRGALSHAFILLTAMTRLLLLLPAALLLSACVKTTYLSDKANDSNTSIYGAWELAEFEGDRGPSAPPAANPVTLTLGPGMAQNVQGQSFINSYSGSLRLEEGRVVEVPRIAMTRKAGPAPLMELESAFFRRWQEAERFERRGDDSAGLRRVRPRRHPLSPPDAKPLTGRTARVSASTSELLDIFLTRP